MAQDQNEHFIGGRGRVLRGVWRILPPPANPRRAASLWSGGVPLSRRMYSLNVGCANLPITLCTKLRSHGKGTDVIWDSSHVVTSD